MKRFKKMMAIAIACAMIIGTVSFGTFGAFAAGSIPSSKNYESPIVVTGLDDGDEVNFYQIIKWGGSEATDQVSGWVAMDPLTKEQLEKILDAGTISSEMAGVLSRGFSGGTLVKTLTAADGKVTFENAESGMYMAIITPKDQNTVYNPVFVSSNYGTNGQASFNVPESSSSYGVIPTSAAAKKTTVKLDKTYTNDNDYTWESGGTFGDETNPTDPKGATTKPGDVLDFTVTSVIPGYGDTFVQPTFKLTDTMKDLKLKPETITVKVKGKTVTKGTETYTLTADENGYTVEFAPAYLKTLKAAADLKIEYKAEVKEGANTNVIKEKNTVELVFSHDPSTETTPGNDEKQYKKDITNHYTFSIDANNLVGPYGDRIGESGSEIIKVGIDKDGNPVNSTKVYSKVTTNEYEEGPLDGAQFTLFAADENGEITNTEVKKAVSDANGRINFKGLDAGVYWLKETKAPAGYVTVQDPVRIEIKATIEKKKIVEYYDQAGNWYTSKTDAENAVAANSALTNKKVTEFEYETEELVSYSIIYGEGSGEIVSSYTFSHVHESSGEIKWNITSSGEAPTSFVNKKGVELPSTGGMGTTLFYIIGAILIIGAGVLLVTRRRTESAE